ncbi:MAG: family 20 glycosylhydrolase [Clostridia bacterium]|nr:family 20 glycosylhydrolase [Clostridia bacterium]
MRMPIPTPKSLTEGAGSVPALLKIAPADPCFAGAVRVYETLAKPLPQGDCVAAKMIRKELPQGAYEISVTPDEVTVAAGDNEGANHAFATLLQITENGRIPCCEIRDESGSSWRGLMLDLSRCWHEKEYLYRAADLCWLYKANRLQLHLTDDQGIRFPFRAYPEAVHEKHYTEEELKDFIAYCNDRGIVVVPEIDAPGHAIPFTKAYPEIFGQQQGIMCASEKAFDALRVMYQEVADLFPDSPYIHVGGDEAAIKKWLECDESKAYMAKHNLADEHQLYGNYILRLVNIVKDLGRTPVVWEGFGKECNEFLPKDILVFAWESYYQIAPELLEAGFTILNASWKPAYVVTRSKMWDPEDILDWDKNRWENWWEVSRAYEKPIVVPKDSAIDGGQMCSWGDKMTTHNPFGTEQEMCNEEFDCIALRFPALCEKLWNPYTTPDKVAFRARINETTELWNNL